jgi:hypothetical protein
LLWLLTTRGKLTAGGKFLAGVTRMNVDFGKDVAADVNNTGGRQLVSTTLMFFTQNSWLKLKQDTFQTF